MHETPSKTFNPERLSERLSEGLPFKVDVSLQDKGSHTVIHGAWRLDHGHPPHNLVPVYFSLALLKKKGGRLESGFDTTTIHPDFQKLGIGKIFSRNALQIFRANNDTYIRSNTKMRGPYFRLSVGFLPTEEETDLNDEGDIFSDWDERAVFMSEAQLRKSLRKKIEFLHESGSINSTLRHKLTSLVTMKDPTFIWEVIDMKLPIVIQPHWQDELERTVHSGELLTEDIQLSTFLDMENPVQMERFHSKTKGVIVDKSSFETITSKYITHERERFSQEERYRGLGSGI